MLRPKAFSVLLHIAGWLLFLILPLLFMESGQKSNWPAIVCSWPFLRFCICYISLFYINTYFLIPDYFIKKKYIIYFSFAILLFTGVFYLRPFDQLMNSRENFGMRGMHSRIEHDFNMPPPPDGAERFHHRPHMDDGPRQMAKRIDINSLLIYVLVMAFGMAIKSVEQWQITEKRAILAEADKAIAELSFLKAQINPHFLYNTLNNIYTLSVIGSDKTSESIMKLSNIMRYVTDEAESDFVPLSSELICISDFIDLQRLRLGKMVTLQYHVSGDSAGHHICPLLLMTFIENVFKYGLSNHLPALIVIDIRIEKDSIIFHSQNTVFEHKKLNNRSGIGIVNTRKRLEHLYPGKYSLDITEADQLFTVDLVLRS
jgi:two-component system LytT family sensor kinase